MVSKLVSTKPGQLHFFLPTLTFAELESGQ
jgi:hypothetical protein